MILWLRIVPIARDSTLLRPGKRYGRCRAQLLDDGNVALLLLQAAIPLCCLRLPLEAWHFFGLFDPRFVPVISFCRISTHSHEFPRGCHLRPRT